MSKINDISSMHGKEFKIYVNDNSNMPINMTDGNLPPTSIIINVVKKENGNDKIIDLVVTDANSQGISLMPFLSVDKNLFNVDQNRMLTIKEMSYVWPTEAAVINAIKEDLYTYGDKKVVDVTLPDRSYVYISKKIVFTNAEDSNGIRASLLDKNGSRLYCDGEPKDDTQTT